MSHPNLGLSLPVTRNYARFPIIARGSSKLTENKHTSYSI
jgi:hypothetical protein